VELALSEVDLSLPQYRILIYLDEGKVQASALADKLSVTRPSVTAVVDGLVTKGLVERHHDPGDRRRVGHDLTSEGRRVLKKCDESVDRRLSDIASMTNRAATSATETSRSGSEDFSDLECWRTALDAYRTIRQEQKLAEKVAAKVDQKIAAKIEQKVVAK
jgi:long-chain acyl-CoA synthetase